MEPPTINYLKKPELLIPQSRYGIQGAPGTGKSVSALTFPNPILLNIANVLPSIKDALKVVHGIDASAITHVPFYDAEFVDKEMKILRTRRSNVLNIRDAVKKWMREESPKIPPGHTLVLDDWTTLQEWFDRAQEDEPAYTKGGEEDMYFFWERKIAYCEELMNYMEQCKCSVVVIIHELQERDKKTGELLDKLQPLMQGKFVTKMKKYFPNFFRAVVREVLDKEKKAIWENNRIKVEYVWQTASDAKFDAKCSRVGLPMYVPAHYNSLGLL